MGKENDFYVFIKSGHLLYCFSCVVYYRLKAFGKKQETHRKISHSTVYSLAENSKEYITRKSALG